MQQEDNCNKDMFAKRTEGTCSVKDLELPADFSEYDAELQTKICQYLKQLTPIEKQAYYIAREHLGSSFSLIYCNGFVQFLNKS